MRLTELQPRWVTDHLLAFLCPCCKAWWLTCKDTPMNNKEQRQVFEREFGEDWNEKVVPCWEGFSWSFSGREFDGLSITPSVDARPFGHWHGWVTNGMIL